MKTNTTHVLRQIVFSILIAVAANASDFYVVITTGLPVPDGNGTFSGFGLPIINDSGKVAFQASVTGATNNAAYGVFLAQTNAPVVQLARRSNLAPDGVSRLGDIFGPNWGDVAINAAGQVAFAGKLFNTPAGANDDTGVFLAINAVGDSIQLIREGQTNTWGSWDEVTVGLDPTLNGRHQSALITSIVGPGVTGTNNIGIFRINTTNLAVTEIARTATLAPDGNGWLSTINQPALNESGQVAFVATLSGATGGTSEGIYRGDGNILVQMARNSPAGMFFSFYPASQVPLNNSGVVAFRASFYEGVTGYDGVFSSDGLVTKEIARSGQGLNGIPNSIYTTHVTLDLNDRGEVLFLCNLTGFAANDPPRALLCGDGSVLRVIGHVGQSVPGTGDTISHFGNTKFSINNGGQIILLASMSGGATALLFHDNSTGLQEIARTGESLLGSTITTLDINGSNGYDVVPRERRSLNNQGGVVFKFTLADGRQGIAFSAKPSLALSAVLLPPNGIQLTFTAIPGWTNYIQACDQNFVFEDIAGPIVGPGDLAILTNFMVADALTNGPVRFYRIRVEK